MKLWTHTPLAVWSGLAIALTAGASGLRAGEADTESQLRALQEQNDALQTQVRKQQELIDSLGREVAEIRQANAKRDAAVEPMKEGANESYTAPSSGGFSLGKVKISGEGGVAYYDSQSQGRYPNSEFRVSEARLFVDAPIWGEVYAFAELNLATPESDSLDVQLGELYVDFENVSQLWGQDRQLNVRAGRMDIPFGEEYLRRDAIDNPLISDSLSDIWGIDEGVELYGSLGKFGYVTAVQNGGAAGTRDFDADKAVIARFSYDPAPWLHVSLSGMRTGNLDAQNDFVSEVWFGDWWFQSLSTNATKFHANIFEGDIGIQLPRGHLRAFGGYAYYDDNDPLANNQRDIYFYCVEIVHDITRKLYAAARFSQIIAPKGYPVVGNGSMIYSDPTALTTDLWLLSTGVGYRFSRNLVIKAEYSFEQGKEANGNARRHENLFATQAAFAF